MAPRLVKMCPCPHCGSFRTEAAIVAGVCLVRSCDACTWMWDWADGRPADFAISADPVPPAGESPTPEAAR